MYRFCWSSVRLEKFKKIAGKFNLTLINDCCHAFGASIDNKKNMLLNIQIS